MGTVKVGKQRQRFLIKFLHLILSAITPYATLYMLRRLGMPTDLGRFMCNMLRSMTYTIRTAYRYTPPYSSKDARLFGTGQGAGCPPPPAGLRIVMLLAAQWKTIPPAC